MGLKIVYHTESQGVKKISLTAMPFRGGGGQKNKENQYICSFREL